MNKKFKMNFKKNLECILNITIKMKKVDHHKIFYLFYQKILENKSFNK